MKHLKRIIKRNITIYKFLINMYAYAVMPVYFLKVISRKKTDIFNFKKLSRKLPYTVYGNSPENALYGIGYTISKKLCFRPSKILCEHGLFFGNHISSNIHIFQNRTIITFSTYRKDIITESLKSAEIAIIGPYIQYSELLFDSEYEKEIVKKFGKILLVFPSHSIKNISSEYNIESFISEIEKVKKITCCESIFICLYWLDARNKTLVNKYINRQYTIVCAGHKYDKYFLSRLKTIINISHYTMSNEVGTHVGYCISQNKPHYIFDENSINEGKISDIIKEENITYKIYESQMMSKKEVYQEFKIINKDITLGQQEIINKYWGEISIH